jgi:para-nitrobenzyl esterase
MLGVAAALAFSSVAQAQAPAPAAAYSSNSTVGDLLDNPATKAVLVQMIPDVVSNPMIDQARGFPLAGLAQFVPTLTPEFLAKIDAALAKVPKA